MKADSFLDQIAARLGRPRQTTPPDRDVAGVPGFYQANPLGGGGLVDRFVAEVQRAGGAVIRIAAPGDAADALRGMKTDSGARKLVAWGRAEFAGWGLDALLTEEDWTVWDGGGKDQRALYRAAAEVADVGLTTVEFGVANTGTLVITTGPERPRSTSLLPSHHVSLVRAGQIVGRMGEAMEGLHQGNSRPASSTLFITGPSRTADIEHDLTIGVHGPAAVTVVLAEA